MHVELYPRIIADPEILSGQPIIEGTHVAIGPLLSQVAAGHSIDRVAGDNSIAVDDVRAALEYAAHLLNEAVPSLDPLARLAGIIDSQEPGWGDSHDQYFASEGTHA